MKRRLGILGIVLLLLCGCAGVPVSKTPVPAATSTLAPVTTPALLPYDDLQVHVIDVGQGDCIFIRAKDATMLIDSGTSSSGEQIIGYLLDAGVEKLDYVVATHPHEDHIGSMTRIIQTFPIGEFLMPDAVTTTKVFTNMLDALEEWDVKVSIPQAGDTFALGACNVTVLGPCGAYDDLNDQSLVIRLVCGDKAFLFMGDAEKSAEDDILMSGADVRADVIKIGHHGSRTSSAYPFIKAVAPTYAVISCGQDNSYGHPHLETIESLQALEATVLRTDKLGNIVFCTDGERIEVVNYAHQTLEYIGNRKSQVVHSRTCNALPAENNRVYFQSVETAIAAGYQPCGNCLKEEDE